MVGNARSATFVGDHSCLESLFQQVEDGVFVGI